jgi:GT2 family glycosyltransferase
MNYKIAVLLTCFNRKDKTLSCLQSLYSQSSQLDIYLVDDGSTDGTYAAVQSCFPDVTLIKGTGSLYWSGGMRLAFSHAMDKGYDYYLWLNDDVTLYNGAIEILLNSNLACLNDKGTPSITIGSMQDPINKKMSYGGRIRDSALFPLKMKKVFPNTTIQCCNAINGNLVLVPKEIALSVGNISSKFTHGLGDFDYSLRAEYKGFKSYIAPGYLGTCFNDRIGFYDKNIPLSERVANSRKPTGLPPIKEWLIFTKRHAGIFWPLYWIKASVSFLFPHIWIFFKSK